MSELCQGSEDENGLPICEGPDVQSYNVWACGHLLTSVRWCTDCADEGRRLGYIVEEVKPVSAFEQIRSALISYEGY